MELLHVPYVPQEIRRLELQLTERDREHQVPGGLELGPTHSVLLEVGMELFAVAFEDRAGDPKVDTTDFAPVTINNRDLSLDVDDPVVAEHLDGPGLEPALGWPGVGWSAGEYGPQNRRAAVRSTARIQGVRKLLERDELLMERALECEFDLIDRMQAMLPRRLLHDQAPTELAQRLGDAGDTKSAFRHGMVGGVDPMEVRPPAATRTGEVYRRVAPGHARLLRHGLGCRSLPTRREAVKTMPARSGFSGQHRVRPSGGQSCRTPLGVSGGAVDVVGEHVHPDRLAAEVTVGNESAASALVESVCGEVGDAQDTVPGFPCCQFEALDPKCGGRLTGRAPHRVVSGTFPQVTARGFAVRCQPTARLHGASTGSADGVAENAACVRANSC